jgi:opacity protein-like surface antigen
MHKKMLLVCAVLLVTGSMALAQSPAKFGVGVFGGISVPVLQEDQGNGTEFGLKGRWGLGSLFTIEPFFTSTKWGEPDPVAIPDGGTFDLGISGSKVTSFGVEAVLGNGVGKMGIAPYFVAGFGSYKVKNDDTGFDHSSLGWSAGLGLGIGLTPQLGLDVRGKLVVIPQDPDGSKKSVGIVGGLNYTFGVGM